MEMKKAKIINKLYDVTTVDNYIKNKDIYDPSYTALEVYDMLLPVIGRIDGRVGIQVGDPDNMVSFYTPPEENIEREYSRDNLIDFKKAKNIGEILQKQEFVKSLENEIIANSDNVFEPRIDNLDSPEMKALKEAVICKQIDINAYAPRFKGNFANDKRLFNDNKITLIKLKKIADALDMKCTLTIEDKSDNVQNPIGRVIEVDITAGGDGDDE